jgi:hypothetical protein
MNNKKNKGRFDNLSKIINLALMHIELKITCATCEPNLLEEIGYF